MRLMPVCTALLIGGLCHQTAIAQVDPNLPPLGISITFGSSQNDDMQRHMLLLRKEVQEELSFDSEQRVRLNVLSKELMAAYQALLPVNRDRKTQTPEERQQALDAIRQRLELQQQHATRCLEILYAEQRGRLEQLLLQQSGARALLRSDVADQINITHAQMDTLKNLYFGRSASSDLRILNPGQPPNVLPNVNKRMEEMRQARERFETEAFSMLTEEQRAAWDKLVGPKFTFVNRTRPAIAPRIPPAPAKPEDP